MKKTLPYITTQQIAAKKYREINTLYHYESIFHHNSYTECPVLILCCTSGVYLLN